MRISYVNDDLINDQLDRNAFIEQVIFTDSVTINTQMMNGIGLQRKNDQLCISSERPENIQISGQILEGKGARNDFGQNNVLEVWQDIGKIE
jgi:hypothetical protein